MSDGHPTTPEASAEKKQASVTKATGTRHSKSSAAALRAPANETAMKLPRAKARKHSEQEKLEKIRQIEEEIAAGGTTLKDTVKKAGISDETYYQWKRAAKHPAPQASASTEPSDAFEDLLKLEEENSQLRKTLAEKLRSENAQLRKKLGLA